jgi:hypothetical protein
MQYIVSFNLPAKRKEAPPYDRESRVSARSVEEAEEHIAVQFPDAFNVAAKVASASGPAHTARARENSQASGANKPVAPAPKPKVNLVKALGGTKANDAAVATAYPFIGDSVRIDIDRVDRMKRKSEHQWCIDHGMHGAVGIVQGAEVRGMYMLLIETGSQRAWVPAECCVKDSLPPQPEQMQPEDRKSPEQMRKHSSGSYNLT